VKVRLLALLALGASIVSLAQTSASNQPTTQEINRINANNVCRIFFQKVKMGSVSQFEQARKQHMQFHKSQGDTWTWHVYQVQTGPNMGMYVTSTCGHTWKDFDTWEQKMGEADAQDAEQKMGPYLAEQSSAFYVYRADLSVAPANRPPTRLVGVSIYQLKPGMSDQFTAAVRQIGELVKADPSRPKNAGWLDLMNGGPANTYVLLLDRQGWADFAPLDKTNRDLANAAMGKEQADALYKRITDSIESVHTESAMFRPDLSYVPGH
jgi:hypothetical protein